VVIDETGYGILECKTASAYKLAEWEHGKVPEAYYWQIQHYLGVTGYKYAYAAALIGGNTFRYTYIERNQQDIDYLTEKATDFWYMHIQPQIPPPVIHTDAEALGQLYRDSNSEKLHLQEEDMNLITGLIEAKNAFKEVKQLEELAKNRIKEKMQESDMCWFQGEAVASWKTNVKGTRVFKLLMKEDDYV
jgi:predicted phage-related endonuclease